MVLLKKNTPKSVTDIQALYTDPSQPGSLGGVARFAKTYNIPLKTAKKALERELGYTLHKPRRTRFPTTPVMVFGMDEQWTMDLIEVGRIAKSNKGIRYLLSVVDVLSKYAWVEPLKSKTGRAVTDGFDNILRRSRGRQPQKVQTDDGKEFYNKTFQNYVKQKGIVHFSTKGDTKASVVERFNRTIKERIYRYLTVKNTFQFLDALPKLVAGYNASTHRSIKMAPSRVTVENEDVVWNNLYAKRLTGKKRKSTLKKGDVVRLNKKHRTFSKGYLAGWTEEVFVVSRVIQGMIPTYKVKEWDGEPLQGTFYEEDLQKVNVKTDDLFRVEKIVKRRKNQVLVRWNGWPAKYDSWIPKSALTNRRRK